MTFDDIIGSMNHRLSITFIALRGFSANRIFTSSYRKWIRGHTLIAPRTSESENKICKSKLKAMAMIKSVANLEFKTTKLFYSEVCLSPQVSHGNSLNPRVHVQEGSP